MNESSFTRCVFEGVSTKAPNYPFPKNPVLHYILNSHIIHRNKYTTGLMNSDISTFKPSERLSWFLKIYLYYMHRTFNWVV